MLSNAVCPSGGVTGGGSGGRSPAAARSGSPTRSGSVTRSRPGSTAALRSTAAASRSSAVARSGVSRPVTFDRTSRKTGRSVDSVSNVSAGVGTRRTAMRSSMPNRSRKAPAARTALASSPRSSVDSSTTMTALRLGSEAYEAPASPLSSRDDASVEAPGPRLTRLIQSAGRGLPSTVTEKSAGRRPSTNRPSRSSTTTSIGMAVTGSCCGAAASATTAASTAVTSTCSKRISPQPCGHSPIIRPAAAWRSSAGRPVRRVRGRGPESRSVRSFAWLILPRRCAPRAAGGRSTRPSARPSLYRVGLIVEVRRRRIAALPAGRHGLGRARVSPNSTTATKLLPLVP